MTDRVRRGRMRGSRSDRDRVSVAVAVTLAVGLVLGGGGWALAGTISGCRSGRTTLSLAADPDIAPAVAAAADRYNMSHSGARPGRCAIVKVTAVDSAEMTGILAGRTAAAMAPRPDIWIPDSSLWVNLARGATGARGLPALEIQSVASSPLVFAVSASTPARVRSELARRSWEVFKPGAGASRFRLRLLDPEQSAAGMASLLVLRSISGTGGDGIKTFAGVLQATSATTPVKGPHDLDTAFTDLRGHGPTEVLVVPELSLRRRGHAESTPDRQIATIDPTMEPAALDFPLVLLGMSADRRRATEEFAGVLRSEATGKDLRRIGLRRPTAAGDTLAGFGWAVQPSALAQARPGAVQEILGVWRRLGLGVNALALIDVSDSSGGSMPGMSGSGTRSEAMSQALSDGLSLMPDDSRFGLWAVSAASTAVPAGSGGYGGSGGSGGSGVVERRDRPYKVLAPARGLGDPAGDVTHRMRLQRMLAELSARSGGRQALYESIDAAYRAVRENYRDNSENVVLVLTDGRAAPADALAARRLASGLKKAFDPIRPVSVIAIGFGADVDMSDLRAVAAATDGGAYTITNAQQAAQLFRRSGALKICDDPQCPD